VLPAQAQEQVSMRFGSHEDYARLVFDWQALPAFEIRQSNDSTLDLVFQKTATANTASISLAGDPRISDIVETGTNPFSVKVSIPDGSEYRHFAIGNRLVLD